MILVVVVASFNRQYNSIVSGGLCFLALSRFDFANRYKYEPSIHSTVQ